jgi:hypothetical protein
MLILLIIFCEMMFPLNFLLSLIIYPFIFDGSVFQLMIFTLYFELCIFLILIWLIVFCVIRFPFLHYLFIISAFVITSYIYIYICQNCIFSKVKIELAIFTRNKENFYIKNVCTRKCDTKQETYNKKRNYHLKIT